MPNVINPKMTYVGDEINYVPNGKSLGLKGQIVKQNTSAKEGRTKVILDNVIQISTASDDVRHQAQQFWQGRKISWGFACFFSILSFAGIPFAIVVALPKFKEANRNLQGWADQIGAYIQLRKNAKSHGLVYIQKEHLLDKRLVTPQEVVQIWINQTVELAKNLRRDFSDSIHQFFKDSSLENSYFSEILKNHENELIDTKWRTLWWKFEKLEKSYGELQKEREIQLKQFREELWENKREWDHKVTPYTEERNAMIRAEKTRRKIEILKIKSSYHTKIEMLQNSYVMHPRVGAESNLGTTFSILALQNQRDSEIRLIKTLYRSEKQKIEASYRIKTAAINDFHSYQEKEIKDRQAAFEKKFSQKLWNELHQSIQSLIDLFELSNFEMI